jgi:DNA-binding XRE family transcriptional regulator
MKNQEIQAPLKRTRVRKPSKAHALRVVKTLKKHNLNRSAAARELGVSPQTICEQVKENPIIKTAIEKYVEKMEAEGLDDDKSIRVISEAMEAKKTTALGEDYATEPDHAIRLKANEQYIKIKKLVAPDKPGTQENHLHLHLGDRKTNEILTELGHQIEALKPKNADN